MLQELEDTQIQNFLARWRRGVYEQARQGDVGDVPTKVRKTPRDLAQTRLEVVVAPGRLTIKAGGSSYASIRIVHWDVLRVLHVIPQKSRTFSKTLKFSRFMQFCSPFF